MEGFEPAFRRGVLVLKIATGLRGQDPSIEMYRKSLGKLTKLDLLSRSWIWMNMEWELPMLPFNPSELPSLKLTTNAPENGWLEYLFPFWDGLFSGANC